MSEPQDCFRTLLSISAGGDGLSLLAATAAGVAGVFTAVFPNHWTPLTGEVAVAASLSDIDAIPILDVERLFEMLRMCCGKI